MAPSKSQVTLSGADDSSKFNPNESSFDRINRAREDLIEQKKRLNQLIIDLIKFVVTQMII